MTRNLWCHIQHWAYNNYYYYIFPAFFHLPKISSYLKKKLFFYTISVNHLFYLSKFHKNIGVTVSGDCEWPFTNQSILASGQMKPVCENLAFWITNNAMGSASINPKIWWSEGSFCEHYFLQPLVDHLVSANTILFNKSIIQDLIQKIQTWD